MKKVIWWDDFSLVNSYGFAEILVFILVVLMRAMKCKQTACDGSSGSKSNRCTKSMQQGVAVKDM